MDESNPRPVPLIDSVPALRMAAPVPKKEVEEWSNLHSRQIEHQSATSFQIRHEAMLFPRPRWVSIQVVRDARYRSEGRLRNGEDHCYFCYTLEGAGAFSKAQRTCQVTAGQGFLLEIDDPEASYFYPPEARAPWRFLAFTFVGLPAKAMVRALTERHGAHFALDPQTPVLRRLLAQQPKEFGIVSLDAAEGAKLVLDLLMALAEAAETTEEIAPEKALVRRAMQILEADTDRNLQVAEWAAAIGVSREHLSRAFHRQLHQSPSEFLRAQRMQRACFLLKGTALSVPQIAAALGYTDSTNFIPAFRQTTGMTPHQFRLHGRLSLATD